MKINLAGKTYTIQDAKNKITVADSFVLRQNKIGKGNGEAKLYIGNDNQETRDFFGETGFKANCFLLKQDLLKYLDETKIEYLNPEQLYNNKHKLPEFWNNRMNKVESLPEIIEFEIIEQTQIIGSRVYIKSADKAYHFIRELSLPNITYLSIVKLLDDENMVFYYFRLFADYFGDIIHPYIIEKENKKIENIKDLEKRALFSKARVGQGKYRDEVLKLCPFCPITMATDDRVLIASHIKPWVKSNDFEKTDPFNGFMFTPTFDYLFDRGFMSFTNDKRCILSPFLSNLTYSKLGISDNKKYPNLPIEGREDYLKYHRNEILK